MPTKNAELLLSRLIARRDFLCKYPIDKNQKLYYMFVENELLFV